MYISNSAPPFRIPGSAPESYQGPKTFWTGGRGVKSSQRHKSILQMEQCIICKKKVDDEEQGLECCLCDQWKHIECVWSVDGPSKSMYEALTEIRSKAILYVCSHCCKRELKHIIKRKRVACNKR